MTTNSWLEEDKSTRKATYPLGSLKPCACSSPSDVGVKTVEEIPLPEESGLHNRNVTVAAGYDPLFEVLIDALNQAQFGKGKERHATDKPFLQQPILQIRRMVGSGYTIGQAMKKAQESQRLPTEAAINDLRGAINYLAAEILARQEGEK
jgi:hypothetical protein